MTLTHAGAVLSPVDPGLPAVERAARIPRGFAAAGRAIGIKASGRPDLAVILATTAPAAAAAVFTPNAFAAAPVRRSRQNLASSGGWIRAVVSTSGSANAATGAEGEHDQARIGEMAAAALAIDEGRVLHLSTGVIGTRLPLDRVEVGLAEIAALLAEDDAGLEAAAVALRTTDSVTKAATVTPTLPHAGGPARPIRVTGIAKGVGMIHPRMATMLSVILTDAPATPELLQSILRPAAARTWNQLSVDGDTSTNDTV
ncbi:MAG: bifunctional ornithine acetyltransferase/N-acetylglutamate synthase, partial [Chloroflexi bacterium]|nr:bifunctional ornithine acetyltransferase/N-acetylglutamate synthase [Chloroflexota bacterium]